MIGVVKKVVMSVEIMMVSTDFVVKPFKLIDLFSFNFVMSMFFDFVDERSGSVQY